MLMVWPGRVSASSMASWMVKNRSPVSRLVTRRASTSKGSLAPVMVGVTVCVAVMRAADCGAEMTTVWVSTPPTKLPLTVGLMVPVLSLRATGRV